MNLGGSSQATVWQVGARLVSPRLGEASRGMTRLGESGSGRPGSGGSPLTRRVTAWLVRAGRGATRQCSTRQGVAGQVSPLTLARPVAAGLGGMGMARRGCSRQHLTRLGTARRFRAGLGYGFLVRYGVEL